MRCRSQSHNSTSTASVSCSDSRSTATCNEIRTCRVAVVRTVPCLRTEPWTKHHRLLILHCLIATLGRLYEVKPAASSMSVSFGQLLSMIHLAVIPTYGTESYRYSLPLLMRIWGHSPIIANRTDEACHRRPQKSHQAMDDERPRRT